MDAKEEEEKVESRRSWINSLVAVRDNTRGEESGMKRMWKNYDSLCSPVFDPRPEKEPVPDLILLPYYNHWDFSGIFNDQDMEMLQILRSQSRIKRKL